MEMMRDGNLDGDGIKKTPHGPVWVVPAELKEAIAYTRSAQVAANCQASEEEKLHNYKLPQQRTSCRISPLKLAATAYVKLTPRALSCGPHPGIVPAVPGLTSAR